MADATIKLFNIKEDPYESNNLALDVKNREKVEEIYARLIELLKEMDPPPDQTALFYDFRVHSIRIFVVFLGCLLTVMILLIWCVCRVAGCFGGKKEKEKKKEKRN